MLIKEKIVDITTGEESIVEREETADEIAYREKAQADVEAQISQAETKAQAKAVAEAKLAALGLTTEDLKALGL
jgi:hypothetical protein